MAYSSIEAIIAAIKADATAAMEATQKKALELEKQGLDNFYASAQPKVYVRTGALGSTAKVGPLLINGSLISFEPYLNTDGMHPVQKRLKTLGDVIEASHNNPSRWRIVGRFKYWDYANNKFQEALDEEMSKYFDRA